MKTLVIYYSRTGTTEKVAEHLAKELKCDIELLRDNTSRSGAVGYLRCGREAMKRLKPKIESIKSDLKKYDMVIIGTPIWSWNMSSLIRSFLHKHKENIKNSAFFCTMGGSGDEKAFKEMAEILEKSPKAKLTLLTKDVVNDNHMTRLQEFINKVKRK